ncbi:hypothetical protein O3G_MSEX001593 [Manduca sexta]|uniref:PHD-type domain-containing protein n=1 Tax=Manduca sexta TaxID=7130 RepID=A0A921YKQ4_MANSE|nr:hypothetical protein O3G_MSEX001593 [Manduca sexta]
MESSEDDAGTATSASRRASAREKDVGQAEDVDATSSYHQDISEGRTSCQTPAMSEDNFDGDSVPSPSTQDVNTSTEAILDMIDEIVDGPGAPKRLPFASFITDAQKEFLISADDSNSTEDSVKLDCEPAARQSQLTLPEDSAKSEVLDTSASSVQVQNSSLCETVSDVEITASVKSPPETVSVPDSGETVVSAPPEPTSAVLLMEPETSVACPSLPSSSASQNDPKVSDSEKQERTLKNVTSSDNWDNITIEKAESTSSDCIVSDTRPPEQEYVKSPLKRRLVRPPPSDRRPDSTVSSTVDSQTVDVFSNIQSSETIAKDVSSSSDAMPTVHGKAEDIRNISDINVCKAEASVSPPKKIKLIRQKVTLPACVEDSSSSDNQPLVKEQCQSTSPDIHVPPVPIDIQLQSTITVMSTSEQESCESFAPVLLNQESSEVLPIKEETQNNAIELIPQQSTTHTSSTIKINEPIDDNSSQIIDESKLSSESSCDLKLQEPVIKHVNVEQPVSSVEKPLTNEELSADKPVCNKLSAEKPISNEPSVEKPHSNELSVEKPDSNEELSVEKPDSNEELNAEKPNSNEELSAQEPSCNEKLSTLEPISNEKLSAQERNSNEKLSAQEPISNEKLNAQESKSNEKLSAEKPEYNEELSAKKPVIHQGQKHTITDDIQQTDTVTELIPLNDTVVTKEDTAENSSNDNNDSELSTDISENNMVQDSVKENCDTVIIAIKPEEQKSFDDPFKEDSKKVPPIKLSLSNLPEASTSQVVKDDERSSINKNESDSVKQIPKLTIRLNNKQSEEIKSPIPKLTIKPIRPSPDSEDNKDNDHQIAPITKLNIKPILKPSTDLNDVFSGSHMEEDKIEKEEQIPSVTKINIKPILKPPDVANDVPTRLHSEMERSNRDNSTENVPSVTKLNIKPILKPPEKINDIHRKSSSSEISESECSENDESTSTSDQASTSDQGPSEIVPKVTIKLGKPGTESEGKFYTEQNIPKLTIKGLQNCGNEDEESMSKLKFVKNQPATDAQLLEKIPKITIKTVSKPEGQPLSPKLTIKPLKPPENIIKESEISKNKSSDFHGSPEIKENAHVPKITIKPITRTESDTASKTPKKSTALSDSAEHIPVVTKLNIKPILKPTESDDIENLEDKVPVVSKLNIKPVVKPKDNELESSIEDVPKITKLNIKPLRNPEVNSSEPKDCDADTDENSIPVVTKINIKPIVKPIEEDVSKDSENQSSETGNSSDDNADIPVVTKLNIKPILKPLDAEETSKSSISSEQAIPTITKLNIKPLVKPDESSTPLSPKKETLKSPEFKSSCIPVVTKLNIKPVVKPEDKDQIKSRDENEEKISKNPPLVMKINMKAVVENAQAVDNEVSSHSENICNNLNEHSNEIIEHTNDLKTAASYIDTEKSHKLSSGDIQQSCDESKFYVGEHLVKEKLENTFSEISIKQNCVTPQDPNVQKFAEIIPMSKNSNTLTSAKDSKGDKLLLTSCPIPKESKTDSSSTNTHISDSSLEKANVNQVSEIKPDIRGLHQPEMPPLNKTPYVQNCKLLKKLLENSRDQLGKRVEEPKNFANCTLLSEKKDSKTMFQKETVNCSTSMGSLETRQSADYSNKNINADILFDTEKSKSTASDKINDTSHSTSYDVTKPLEINISEKYSGQSSGQDSPRIILKINKTDHGASAKIITEDIKRPDSFHQKYTENTQENITDRESPRKHILNSRRKINTDESVSLTVGKRLRSSRIVENTDKSPVVRRNVGKRPSTTEVSPVQNKETELTVLETKRLKLGQLLSGNKSLSITPVVRATQLSPTKLGLDNKQGAKVPNHAILNNENCSKNGNSKLHNILSNLQAKQKQSIGINDTTMVDKNQYVSPDAATDAVKSNLSNVVPVENCHVKVQEMIINENCDLRDHGSGPEEVLQDPLEVSMSKAPCDVISEKIIAPRIEELTPQPKKRGRPRKLPVSEGAKPTTVTLPVPALEERPQRSLRLTRDRPTILTKPRGRGRGRGRRVQISMPSLPPETLNVPVEDTDERVLRTIDPTSSRIKLPRMTEALDKMPGGCSTPLSSRRRTSSGAFSEGELKVVLESAIPKIEEAFIKSPEIVGRGRGGRGSRGGRGRTPRGRGRGRGGGRGAVYMKETMGIYGRVCGPATTTVQLFEEETCMMDDNATPAKPSHLLDEDSQSSVKSSTNESSKMKKSKFSDLFDSNKVWTAADVKEYTWPTQEGPDTMPQVMMIQEQVAMFLGVKSFKRRYPELKRRPIVGEEKDFVLAKGLVTEALCDLGITAVDASEVLDIMLSDYPHKYEEYRSHQRERQLTEPPPEPPVEVKPEEKLVKVEVKPEKPVEQKPELPKIDPEKTRQDMAAAAIASASEWNARANAWRRPACVDLQSLCVHRRRAPPARAPSHLRPPAGFYPHALLPGQYQHCYRTYTPEQLRYFPLNTALVAPPAPPSPVESSSDSEQEWGSRSSSSEDSDSRTQPAKRKKLSKVKRSSQAEIKEKEKEKDEPEPSAEDTCRVCKLRLEGNRKYTHERFLVCASCQAKLHPSCVELSADTIRKCREYPWQCAECKTCCSCRLPADDDKMLFCDLCDRGFHIYCVGLDAVPTGRWHCVECAVCKSCGARSPGGLPAPDAATRRGPGGHKVYSHSLCTPCARAYRIGRYCPLCERSFIGPKGTMQLVICKLCDRQLHQECVRQTVSSLNVLDYTCAECRRGGITSRAAAARLAPRTIATLFMAKRRFNKYAHRQYMRSRMLEAEAEAAAAAAREEEDASADASLDPSLDPLLEPLHDPPHDPLQGAG